MKYLLDNNILSYFFMAGQEAELARCVGSVELTVVEQVYDEAARAPAWGARFKAWLSGSGVKQQAIYVGSKEDEVLLALHPDASNLKDYGEHASIAFAASNPDHVLVTNDRNALYLALAELHHPQTRVVRPAAFLRRLHEHASFPAAAVGAVMHEAWFIGRPNAPRIPSWWGGWFGSLS